MAILKYAAQNLKGNEPLNIRYWNGSPSLFTWPKAIPRNKTLIGTPTRVLFSNGEVLFGPGARMYGLHDGSILYTGHFKIRIKRRRNPAPTK